MKKYDSVNLSTSKVYMLSSSRITWINVNASKNFKCWNMKCDSSSFAITHFWWYFSFHLSVCTTSLVPFLGATDWCSSCEHAVLSECRLKFPCAPIGTLVSDSGVMKNNARCCYNSNGHQIQSAEFHTHTNWIETKWMTALTLRFLSITRKRFVYSNMIWQLVYRRVKIKQQIFWSNEGRTHQSALTSCSFLLFMHVHALHRDVSPLRANKDFNYFLPPQNDYEFFYSHLCCMCRKLEKFIWFWYCVKWSWI